MNKVQKQPLSETENQLKEKIGDDDSEIAGCNVKLKLLKVGRKR